MIGTNSLMKLLLLSKTYSCFVQPGASRTRNINPMGSILLLLVTAIALGVAGCSEKTPFQQVDEEPLEVRNLTLGSDFISDTVHTVLPSIGSNGRLIIGKDEYVSARALIRFTSHSNLPDTIDQMLHSTLYLYTDSELPYDTLNTQATEIAIYLLESDQQQVNWTEDSLANDFSLDGFDKTLLTTFHYQNWDTLALDFPLAAVEKLHIIDSTDNYGLLLEPLDTNSHTMQAIYSSENSSFHPYMEIEYIDDGDTATGWMDSDEDITLLRRHSHAAKEHRLYVNNGFAYRSCIRVAIEDTVRGKHTIIGVADLRLQIDTSETRLYGENMYLYMTLLDSTEMWMDADFLPSGSQYIASSTVLPGDTELIFKVPSTIQQFTSDYRENYGLMIWPASSNLNISLLSLWANSDPDSSQRPTMNVITIDEKY